MPAPRASRLALWFSAAVAVAALLLWLEYSRGLGDAPPPSPPPFDMLLDSRALLRWQGGVVGEEYLQGLRNYDVDGEATNAGCRTMTVPEAAARSFSKSMRGLKSFSVFDRWASDSLAVSFTNAAYVKEGLVPNLICSLNRLNWTSWVLVVTDPEAYTLAVQLGYSEHLYWAPEYWNGTSQAALRTTYNTTDAYLAFIHRRTLFARSLVEHLLEMNEKKTTRLKKLVFTDGDTVWMHDPIKVLDELVAEGRGGKCDAYVVNDINLGKKTERKSRVEPVGGFLIFNLELPGAGRKLRRLYQVWTDMMGCLGSREQPALHASLSLMNCQTASLWTPFDDGADVLSLCVLPDFHFPTSAHLTMHATDRGPTSNYLQDYRIKFPSSVGSSVVVAHSNLKYKANKVAWMSQFRFFMWDPAAQRCKYKGAGGGDGLLRLTEGLKTATPAAPINQGLGWTRGPDGKGAWVHDIAAFLDFHRSPGEKWNGCRAEVCGV